MVSQDSVHIRDTPADTAAAPTSARPESGTTEISMFDTGLLAFDNGDARQEALGRGIQDSTAEATFDAAALEAEIATMEADSAALKALKDDAFGRITDALALKYEYNKQMEGRDKPRNRGPIKSFGDIATRVSDGVKRGAKAIWSFMQNPMSALKKSPEPLEIPGPARFDDGKLVTLAYIDNLESEIGELETSIETFREMLRPVSEEQDYGITFEDVVNAPWASGYEGREDVPLRFNAAVTAPTHSDDTPPPVPPKTRK